MVLQPELLIQACSSCPSKFELQGMQAGWCIVVDRSFANRGESHGVIAALWLLQLSDCMLDNFAPASHAQLLHFKVHFSCSFDCSTGEVCSFWQKLNSLAVHTGLGMLTSVFN